MRVSAMIFVSMFLALPASGAMVRGIIADSASGLPVSNVKVILTQLQGEREEVIDSLITGITGSYSFGFSNPVGSGFLVRTIENQHYFQNTAIRTIAIDDTINQDIRLKRIPTKISGSHYDKTSSDILLKTSKSRLYVSGIETGAVIDIYNINGHLLSRVALPKGVHEISWPQGIASTGYYQAKITTNGGMVHSVPFIAGISNVQQ